MRKLVLATAVVAFGFMTSQASAVTVLTTTQGDVKKQCAGKTKCSTACGSTLCDYVCDDPKRQCTVAIFIKRPPPPRRPRPYVTGGSYSPR
ncbi:recombinational DNA repair protein RecR [Bradyrhizobium japonicum]